MEKLTKLAIVILIIGFLVSLSSILISVNCNENNFDKCLIEKKSLLPDFYWHFNTIKYISTYGHFPYRVAGYNDGGPNGDFIPESDAKQPMFHPPLYYFLAAIPYKITESLFSLFMLSIILMLLTNIIFFFFLKEISKKVIGKDSFILYSLALFIFLPIQLFTSIIIHPGILFAFFLILSLYFFMKAINSLEIRYFIFLGIAIGLSMLTDLKGFVLPSALLFYLIILLTRKNYYKIKLVLTSLLISVIIGSYQFIKNYLQFGSPFGPWRIETKYLIHYKFTRLFEIFTAYWGGIYGGNKFIHPFLITLILILVLVIVYSLFSLKFWRNLNLEFILLIGLITVILLIGVVCNFTYILKDFKCVGVMAHARYLVPLSPIVSIFPSIIFSKVKSNFFKKITFLFVLFICILFSIDFIWAFF